MRCMYAVHIHGDNRGVRQHDEQQPVQRKGT
jgi:hypothetical protein